VNVDAEYHEEGAEISEEQIAAMEKVAAPGSIAASRRGASMIGQ